MMQRFPLGASADLSEPNAWTLYDLEPLTTNLLFDF